MVMGVFLFWGSLTEIGASFDCQATPLSTPHSDALCVTVIGVANLSSVLLRCIISILSINIYI
jgi:hypothetical protein